MSERNYDEWPVWRLWLAWAGSVLWPGSTEWQDIAPVLERKTAFRRCEKKTRR